MLCLLFFPRLIEGKHRCATAALVLFYVHVLCMGRKSSTQSDRFFYVYLPIVQAECLDFEFEFFNQQLQKNCREMKRK